MSNNDPIGEEVRALEALVGHPGDLLEELESKIQARAISKFQDIEEDWLRLMWAIDAYRIRGLLPRGMGKAGVPAEARLGAVYRSKGNWFATLIALLLQNQTSQQIRPRTNVQGFSQLHQIDLAWPAREKDSLVCVETKVTGAPAFGSTPSRSAYADFSNRRKELKFAATDLKLYRRQQETVIEHWGVWREKAPPKTYFLWAARLKTHGRRDDIKKLIVEALALVTSYLDGVGIIAWHENAAGTGYEAIRIPAASAQVADLDNAIYRIASEIKALVGPGGKPPEPIVPETTAVDIERLSPDAGW